MSQLVFTLCLIAAAGIGAALLSRHNPPSPIELDPVVETCGCVRWALIGGFRVPVDKPCPAHAELRVIEIEARRLTRGSDRGAP